MKFADPQASSSRRRPRIPRQTNLARYKTATVSEPKSDRKRPRRTLQEDRRKADGGSSSRILPAIDQPEPNAGNLNAGYSDFEQIVRLWPEYKRKPGTGYADNQLDNGYDPQFSFARRGRPAPFASSISENLAAAMQRAQQSLALPVDALPY